MNHEKIRDIMIKNDFITINDCIPTPLIAIFRNTAFLSRDRATYLPDEGNNITDTVFLVDDQDIYELMGRSYPHDKYQKRMVAGTAKANYIASAYYFQGLRKGFHLNVYPALRENIKFLVWRSLDMDLQDDDDYTERGNVSDNFHGWAPMSAGCMTVRGKMGKIDHPEDNTGDWKVAYDWIYETCSETFFNNAILEYDDLSMDRRLRIGSKGGNVYNMQERLRGNFNIKADGDFGPWSHEIVRQFQRSKEIDDTGIYDPETERLLWSVT